MAVQIPDNATANLNEEEKAALEKFVKEFNDKNAAASEADIAGKNSGDVITTTGYLINLHKVKFTDLQMIDSKEWSGTSDPKKPVPKSLQWWPLRPFLFGHQGPAPEGSVAGFVYADGTANDPTARKWLVAFDTVQNKVWVEAGPMGPVDWAGIKFKLDHLAKSESKYTDPVLGGEASATINNNYIVAFFSN